VNDPNESWSTPWHRLHETLAKGFAADHQGPAYRRGAEADFRVIPTGSWLARARSRKAQVLTRTSASN
jgi:hypothetical protein